MKLTFNKYYFALAALLFVTEVLIARYVTNNFIRSYFGDVLVVILIHCFVKIIYEPTRASTGNRCPDICIRQ